MFYQEESFNIILMPVSEKNLNSKNTKRKKELVNFELNVHT